MKCPICGCENREGAKFCGESVGTISGRKLLAKRGVDMTFELGRSDYPFSPTTDRRGPFYAMPRFCGSGT